MSDYVYWITAIADNQNIGNSVASLVAAEPGDHNAFDRGVPLYPAGTTFTQPSNPLLPPVPSNPPCAWYVGVPAKQAAYDVAAEFASDGPYPLLNTRGMSDAQVAVAKAHVKVQVGPRGTTEPQWRSFIESLGYVIP